MAINEGPVARRCGHWLSALVGDDVALVRRGSSRVATEHRRPAAGLDGDARHRHSGGRARPWSLA